MEVMLIDENGSKIGNVDIEEARRLASESGNDLVKVNSKDNIYRIANAGKLMYEKKQSEKKMRDHKRTHKVKEIKIGLNIDEHDLNIKIKHVIGFLNKGIKTKITMQLKGRQNNFKDMALTKLNCFLQSVVKNTGAIIDVPPKFEGNRIIAFINSNNQIT